MLFPSTIFLFAFLPALLLLYYSAPAQLRNAILLVASLFFYAWGETAYVLLMLLSIVVNYGFGRAIGASRDAQRRAILTAALGINLASLAWFKYAGFLSRSLNALLTSAGLPETPVPQVHLPLGISFFTFQAMSYLIDVYRGITPAQRRLDQVALYISLFPQLIAGPIVRYHDVATQISRRAHTTEIFASGVRRFVLGLAKKMLIANTLGQIADDVFATPLDELGPALAWLGIACYALQIYFDFSAYSDMAIGLGRMFGFRFLENFNYPYMASSLTDFWRRWHISLSRWFRDYLYIPLGGNRRSRTRTYLNLSIVFLLCGLWHGASWNFVIWGAIHGAVLVLERAGLRRILDTLPALLQHAYTLLIVLCAWIYFRAETLTQANAFLLTMFGQGSGSDTTARAILLLTPEVLLTLIAASLLSTPVYPRLARAWRERSLLRIAALDTIAETGLFASLLVLSLAYVAAGTYNPFIYFRF